MLCMFAVHGAKQGRVITEEQGSVLEQQLPAGS